MAARPQKNLTLCNIITRRAAEAIENGRPVIFGSSDRLVINATANSRAIGFALADAASGEDVQIGIYAPLIMVVVGTGGATRGKYLKVVSDGVCDVEAAGGGTTAHQCVAMAMESGTVGQMISAQLTAAVQVSAS